MCMPSASHSDSITAVVSGVVRPGSSSIESSRRYRRPASVVNAFSRAARYFSSRRFIFSSAGQTYARSFANSASSTVSPTDATRARTRSTRSAGTCAFTHAAGVGRHLRLRELRRKIERDVARQHAAAHERVFARVELAADGLMVGVEAPRDAPAVESGLELRQHAAVAHAFDALALMPFGHARADERKRHRVEPPFEHRVDVVHELARNAVLVGRHAELERAHRPLDRRPVQRRETRADAERAAAEIGAGCRKDRRVGIVLLHGVLQAQQVLPARRKCDTAVTERDASASALPPVPVARAAEASTRSRRSPRPPAASSVPPRSRSGSSDHLHPGCRCSFALSAGQSRQKSGLMHGFCEMRMLLSRRNRLMRPHQMAMA